MTELTLRLFLTTGLLLVCWWLWAIEYRRYRVLLLKSSLFEARDDLFGAAMRGTLSFDDPAYGMTRTILNGMLRQADALSLPHIVGMMLTRFWWSSARVEHRFDAQFDRAQAQLTDEGRAAIRKIMDQAHVAIVSHMLHISFTLGPVVQALKLWYAWRATRATTTRASADLAALIVRASNTRNSMHQSLGTLDASAHLVGDLDTAPGLLRAV